MEEVNLNELLEKASAEPVRRHARDTKKGSGLAQLVPVIEALRAKNMTWREVTEWLNAAGFPYKEQTIQTGYSRLRKEPSK